MARRSIPASVDNSYQDMYDLFTVRLGVDGSLGEQVRMLLGGHAQLIVEGAVPSILHVVIVVTMLPSIARPSRVFRLSTSRPRYSLTILSLSHTEGLPLDHSGKWSTHSVPRVRLASPGIGFKSYRLQHYLL